MELEAVRNLWKELEPGERIPIIQTAPETTWIWSDPHLGDRSMLLAWDRPFRNVDEMKRPPAAELEPARRRRRHHHLPRRRRPSGRLTRPAPGARPGQLPGQAAAGARQPRPRRSGAASSCQQGCVPPHEGGPAGVAAEDGDRAVRTVIDIELPTSSRDELVVPVAVKLIGNQRDGVHLRLGHRHAGRVLTAVEFRLYLKPGLSSCVADAVDDGLVGRQRGATPVGVALLRRRPRELRRASRQELTRRRRGGAGGGGGSLTGGAVLSALVIPLVFARFVEVPVRVEVAAGP